jgi:predicted amidohydrolase YtcJ
LVPDSFDERTKATLNHLHIHYLLLYYGEALEDHIIGQERTEKILPLKAAENNSLIFSLHADQPMFESDPLSLLHTAVNRKTRDGKIVGKSNKISVVAD